MSENRPAHYLLQVIQPGLLKEGFELVRQRNLEVTDDVSIVEALGKPVKVTHGSYTNIKVCTCSQAAQHVQHVNLYQQLL